MKKQNEEMKKNDETTNNENEIDQMRIYGVHEIGTPIIVAEFQGERLLFVLDTGSDTNFLDERVYEHFKDSIEATEGNGFVIGVEGNEIPRGKLVTVPMQIVNRQLSVKFFTLPQGMNSFEMLEKQHGLRLHGILGTPFILHNRLIIDLTNGEMRLGEEKLAS